MDTPRGLPQPRVGLLFTRFPVPTETFLQREVLALRTLGHDWPVLSLWPAPDDHVVPQVRVETFPPWRLLSLFGWIPYWLLRRPSAMLALARALVTARVPNPVNLSETLLGLGYAIIHARAYAGRFDHLHAVWASAPATAAWALRELVGIPFSMAGHAYDLYEDGGDGLLPLKIPAAAWIRTSTEAGRQRWLELGARPGRVHLIRRGLHALPDFQPARPLGMAPVRLLAVGRLVEKMGYPVLLEVLAHLQVAGLPFSATLIGGGPLRGDLEALCRRLGLADRVVFAGPLPFAEVAAAYREADLFLFGGTIARSGDRAGFPNAIGEAMAWGVPVCARAVGAVAEGVRHGETGLLFDSPREAARDILVLLRDPQRHARIRTAARRWAETEFDATRNMARLAALLLTPPTPARRASLRDARAPTMHPQSSGPRRPADHSTSAKPERRRWKQA